MSDDHAPPTRIAITSPSQSITHFGDQAPDLHTRPGPFNVLAPLSSSSPSSSYTLPLSSSPSTSPSLPTQIVPSSVSTATIPTDLTVAAGRPTTSISSLSTSTHSTTAATTTSSASSSSTLLPIPTHSAASHSSSGLSTGTLVVAIVVPIIFAMVVLVAGATWYIMHQRKTRKRVEAEAYERYGPDPPSPTQQMAMRTEIKPLKPPTRPIDPRSRSQTMPADDRSPEPGAALRGNPTLDTSSPAYHNSLPFHNSRTHKQLLMKRSVPEIITATPETPMMSSHDDPASPFEDDNEYTDSDDHQHNEPHSPFDDPTPLARSTLITTPLIAQPSRPQPREVLRESNTAANVSRNRQSAMYDAATSSWITADVPLKSVPVMPVPPPKDHPALRAKARASRASIATDPVNAPASVSRIDEFTVAPLRPQLQKLQRPDPPPKSSRRPLSISPVASSSASARRKSTTSPVSPLRVSRTFPPHSVMGSLRSNPNPRSITASLRSDDEISAMDETEIEFGQADRADLGSAQRASVIDLNLNSGYPYRSSRFGSLG